jgi:hypothetical protein
MSTFEALQILIFLIPGFISAILLDKIMGREKKERDLAIFVEALILSFIIYVIYSLFYDSSPVYFDEQKKTAVVKSWWALGLILLCSFLLPAFFSFLHHSGIYMRLFRKMRVTSYTGGRDTWEEIFKTKYRSIIVNFEDGHRLQGWAEYVAGTYDNPMIYLLYPQWVKQCDNKSVYEKIEGADGLLITPEYKIKYIEFLKNEKESE